MIMKLTKPILEKK